MRSENYIKSIFLNYLPMSKREIFDVLLFKGPVIISCQTFALLNLCHKEWENKIMNTGSYLPTMLPSVMSSYVAFTYLYSFFFCKCLSQLKCFYLFWVINYFQTSLNILIIHERKCFRFLYSYYV